MLKILLQAFFLLLKNNVNQNKRGFSVPSAIRCIFFGQKFPKKDAASISNTKNDCNTTNMWRDLTTFKKLSNMFHHCPY